MNTDFAYSEDGRIAHGHIERVMGTRFDMIIPDIEESAARSLWNALCDWLRASDAMLDRFNAGSEVSRLNTGSESVPSADLSVWIEKGERYGTLTGGLFSIRAGGQLDFGGLAKGVSLGFAKELLVNRGVLNAYVDFGGSSILGLGHHPYGPEWKVSVTDPYSGRILTEVGLCDTAISTSGNTPGYSAHIINPLTGERCTARRAVSVVSGDPADAEVLSTVLMFATDGQKKRILDFFPMVKASIFEL